MKKEIGVIIVSVLMVMGGCSSQKVATNSTPQVAPTSPATVETPSPKRSSTIKRSVPATAPQAQQIPSGHGFDQWQTGPIGDVFFGYDSSALSTEAQEQLQKNAAWLVSNTNKTAVIEGHCDSRGTSEYNLALGERRASSSKEYITRLGVAPARLDAISLGEERPFALGTGEEAWLKNRRAHFIVK